ncbi:DUF1007 family protein [Arcobacter defluvii]|uniref:DUF1007 domain-containing protein n=1 Tax=Arcobacter defluvii TaxID=873191 RepID=A0AAE7E6J3_9BACT|nr:DUF1007 family protein [Arcobacter defluvii]QKF77452.1 DUF1007 domain-containing protein [Arcobacter defluvii]RXI32090.1 hypothetical protein CP964_08925 [Arcobacter defluvii]
MMWKFDEMTSELLIMEFDENCNGKIDEKEQKYIKENYFQMVTIQILQPFLKRIFIFSTLEQRDIEIKNFTKDMTGIMRK